MDIKICRGTHEIGGSCVELQSGNGKIVLDIGIPLVNNNGDAFNMHDYDMENGPLLVEEGILPDIKGLYKWDNDTSVDGVIISHSHADHIGFHNYVRSDINFFI